MASVGEWRAATEPDGSVTMSVIPHSDTGVCPSALRRTRTVVRRLASSRMPPTIITLPTLPFLRPLRLSSAPRVSNMPNPHRLALPNYGQKNRAANSPYGLQIVHMVANGPGDLFLADI